MSSSIFSYSLANLWLGIFLGAFVMGRAAPCRAGEEKDFLVPNEQELAQAEAQMLTEVANRMNELQKDAYNDQRVEIGLSQKVTGKILEQFKGMSFSDASTGATLTLKDLNAHFQPGFPRVDALVSMSDPAAKIPVELRVRAVLQHEWLPAADRNEPNAGCVCVQLKLLGAEPTATWLPGFVAKKLSAEVVHRFNEKIPTAQLPIPRTYLLQPKPQDIARINASLRDLPVDLPNGKLHVALSLPPLPKIRLTLAPQVFYGDTDGVHVIALIGGSAMKEPQAASSHSATAEQMEALLKSHRLPAGKDLQVRVPAPAILAQITALNQLPPPQRTLTATAKPDGHILDRTGGAPFGNGFQSWFEGTPNASAILSRIGAAWNPSAEGIVLSGHADFTGRAQVHAHGNAPHINAPKIFGKPIGGGATIGGGAGTSVGGDVKGAPNAAGSLSYEATSHEFVFKLTAPSRVHFSVHSGGIVGEVIERLKLGFDVNVPLQSLQAHYPIPEFIVSSATIPSLSGKPEEAKNVTFQASDITVEVLSNGFQGECTVDCQTVPSPESK